MSTPEALQAIQVLQTGQISWVVAQGDGLAHSPNYLLRPVTGQIADPSDNSGPERLAQLSFVCLYDAAGEIVIGGDFRGGHQEELDRLSFDSARDPDMAEAVTLAPLDGIQRVDSALGHAACYQRFGTGDLVSIRTVGPVDEWIQATDIHSLQPSTKAWERFAGGGEER